MSEKPVCEIPKNSREVYQFRLGEYKGHKFADMRIFTIEPGENGAKPKDPAPTKKGLAVSPSLWKQFKAALAQVEAAMIKEGGLTGRTWKNLRAHKQQNSKGGQGNGRHGFRRKL